MLNLVTGVPGAGKSLWAVDQVRKARAEGRPVFAQGVTDLDMVALGVLPLDVRRWQDPSVVPDGSLVVVDEAHLEDRFPQRMAGKSIPEYIAGLRTHRHRGLDFIIITQAPKDVDVALRRLVGRHLHLENLFGTKTAQIFEWNKCNDRPDDRGARYGAVKKTWPYPSDAFDLYKSASMHTVKVRFPWRIVAVPVLLALLGVLAWFGYHVLHGISGKDVQTAKASELPSHRAPSAAELANPASASKALENLDAITAQAYAAKFIPRVGSQPWSSPAFDDRKVVAQPDLYCMAVEHGPCICHTEQGTTYRLKDYDCRVVARYGMYNPFRVPVEDRSRDRLSLLDHSTSADQVARPKLDGDGLKASGAAPITAAAETWPRPDFGYRVPFPSNRQSQ